jgi:ABC-2 type transport system ATP-binding protein
MQLLPDHLIVIGRGAVLADDTVEGFLAKSVFSDVLLRVPELATLMAALTTAGLMATFEGTDGLLVAGASTHHRSPDRPAGSGAPRCCALRPDD